MKTMVVALIALLVAAPVMAGSLTITSTDGSGRTSTVRKTYPRASKDDKTSSTDSSASGRGTAEEAMDEAQKRRDAQNRMLLEKTKKMLEEQDALIEKTVEEFQKDLKKVQ